MSENSRSDIAAGGMVAGNADVLAGWTFCATIQRRTPLRILLRHGEFHPDILSEPPQYALALWEGTWVPQTKSWKDLTGRDFPEFDGGMASEIGVIPREGGEYLQFLLAVRRIVEPVTSIRLRVAQLQAELTNERWLSFCNFDGHSITELTQYFFPQFLDCIPRLRTEAKVGLRTQGIVSPHDVLNSSYEQLGKVSGLGKRTYEVMTAFASEVSDSCEEGRLDYVNR